MLQRHNCMELETRHPERNIRGYPIDPCLSIELRDIRPLSFNHMIHIRVVNDIFCNTSGLHKGDARSGKIARCNDAPTIGVLGTGPLFAMPVQICKRWESPCGFEAS